MQNVVDPRLSASELSQSGGNLRSLSSKPLSLADISKRYGNITAVKKMSLSVPAGELVSLLGPSGCGKTTTLRLIAGFEFPDTGDIRIGDECIAHLPPNKRGLGMVFQSYSLFPHLNVAENIAFGLRMAGVSKSIQAKKVAEMLAMIRMEDFASRKISQMSGGQQQRVALARALVTNPSVLLLDEPLGALDKNLRQGMQMELRTLQQKLGITSIMVTHDQEEALTMSDSVVVMNQGEVLQVGSPQEVYNHPQTRFVAEFLGTANILRYKLVEVTAHGANVALLSTDNEPRFEITVPKPLAGFPIQSTGELAIRPEKIALSTAAPHPTEGMLTLQGRIVNHVFRGAQHAYMIDLLELGQTISVYQHANIATVRPAGSLVSCSLYYPDVVLLNSETRLEQ